MTKVFEEVEKFLRQFCQTQAPLLLALSGGPDSLCLFYALVAFREKHSIPFHVAHVDHGWRPESASEAQILKTLCLDHRIPFHLKVLNPILLKGNLEAACREERYNFFAQLNCENDFQGVLTGHHQDDLAETVLKRLLEGAHWSRWGSLQQEINFLGMRLLRPLLRIAKREIQSALLEKNIQAFEDSTNHDPRYLRSRMRQSIFPQLNEQFGKDVKKSMIALSQDAIELNDYFYDRLAPLLKDLAIGPWGMALDLEANLPCSLLEIKYLLRLLCRRENFYLSRNLIEQAAVALQSGKANQNFAMGERRIHVDRKRIFIFSSFSFNDDVKDDEIEVFKLSPGEFSLGNWTFKVSEEIFHDQRCSSWKEGWKGSLQCMLLPGEYCVGYKKPMYREWINLAKIKKRWSQDKVPAFLYHFFPIIWQDKKIFHEFLTGRLWNNFSRGLPCWRVDVNHGIQKNVFFE